MTDPRSRTPGHRPSGVLRVASYNVRDLKDDAAAAARIVRQIAPDALCVQEIPRHPLSGHRVADFANACGMLFSGGHQGSGGTTVFTSLRVDVLASAHHRLPVAPFRRRRGYAVTRVTLPGSAPVQVVSVHLGLDSAERVRHVQAVLALVGRDGPVVLGADLNESAEGPAWRWLTGSLRALTGPAPTFPARAPRARIDALFATPDLDHAGPSTVALDAADLRAATDHLPVWTDLAVPPRAG